MRQETADRIVASFDRHGWGKGPSAELRGEAADGPVCLSMAAADATLHDDRPDYAGAREWMGCMQALATRVEELFPQRVLLRRNHGIVVAFNDHPQTTFEDVQLVIKHAVTGGKRK